MHPNMQVYLHQPARDSLIEIRSQTTLTGSEVVRRLLTAFARGRIPTEAATKQVAGRGERHGFFINTPESQAGLEKASDHRVKQGAPRNSARSDAIRSLLAWCAANNGRGLEDDRQW